MIVYLLCKGILPCLLNLRNPVPQSVGIATSFLKDQANLQGINLSLFANYILRVQRQGAIRRAIYIAP